MLHAVDQPVVDLVGDDDEVVLLRHGGNLIEALATHHRARGVVGRSDEEGLRPLGDCLLDVGGQELEAVLGAGGDGHGHRAHQLGRRRVGDEAGFGKDDLVTRVEQGRHGQIEGLRDPHRDQNLAGGVVGLPIEFIHLLGDSPPQLDKAGIGGVVGLPPLQRFDSCPDDGLRRVEVRLADAQADHVLHGGGDIEEATDARRCDTPHSL